MENEENKEELNTTNFEEYEDIRPSYNIFIRLSNQYDIGFIEFILYLAILSVVVMFLYGFITGDIILTNKEEIEIENVLSDKEIKDNDFYIE